MELRHLETLIAIEEEGTFTAAADMLRTVQSNVSEQVRQLEAELGVTLLARGRSGATAHRVGWGGADPRPPHPAGAAADARGRRRAAGPAGRERELRDRRYREPVARAALVADLRKRPRASSCGSTKVRPSGCSPRCWNQELAQAVVTEPVRDERLAVEHLLDEDLVGLAPPGTELPPEPVPFEALAEMPLVLPPAGNPLRIEIEQAARARGVTLQVPVEVEGIRLIADLVAAGAGVSVLPETAIPPELASVVIFSIADLPQRRLALISPKASPLSLADRAVRETVLQIVAATRVRPRSPAIAG